MFFPDLSGSIELLPINPVFLQSPNPLLFSFVKAISTSITISNAKKPPISSHSLSRSTMNPNQSTASKSKANKEVHFSSDDSNSDYKLKRSVTHAVQCETCSKFRRVSKQKYEEIRSKATEEPFVCKKKPNVSCEDPPDLEYNDSSLPWAVDKPNIPKTPFGFQRKCIMRKDFSEVDVHYVSPGGTKLRTFSDVSKLLKEYPEWNLSLSDFSFDSPEVADETVVSYLEKKGSSSGTNDKKLKKAPKDDA